MKIIQSRNKREGYYAGYYSYDWLDGYPAGHRRWDSWAMSEFYPKVLRNVKVTEADRFKHTGRLTIKDLDAGLK